MLYVRKPIVVKAVQVPFKNIDWMDIRESWFWEKVKSGEIILRSMLVMDELVPWARIATNDDIITASAGEWIVYHVAEDKFYVCSDEYFRINYEEHNVIEGKKDENGDSV